MPVIPHITDHSMASDDILNDINFTNELKRQHPNNNFSQERTPISKTKVDSSVAKSIIPPWSSNKIFVITFALIIIILIVIIAWLIIRNKNKKASVQNDTKNQPPDTTKIQNKTNSQQQFIQQQQQQQQQPIYPTQINNNQNEDEDEDGYEYEDGGKDNISQNHNVNKLSASQNEINELMKYASIDESPLQQQTNQQQTDQQQTNISVSPQDKNLYKDSSDSSLNVFDDIVPNFDPSDVTLPSIDVTEMQREAITGNTYQSSQTTQHVNTSPKLISTQCAHIIKGKRGTRQCSAAKLNGYNYCALHNKSHTKKA